MSRPVVGLASLPTSLVLFFCDGKSLIKRSPTSASMKRTLEESTLPAQALDIREDGDYLLEPGKGDIPYNVSDHDFVFSKASPSG